MRQSRRDFLKQLGAVGGLAACSGAVSAASAAPAPAAADGSYGVLVDTTRCVGCRRCEGACNAINTDLPRREEGFFRGQAVFEQRRRMDEAAYTVVNRYPNAQDAARPAFVKFQCMHCLKPACVSACIVGALTRAPTGAVVYDAWKCIGCRYCMMACPFQVPGYEYHNPFTPQVRKCHLCNEARLSKGLPPACVQACPMEVMTWGQRAELLDMAKDRIRRTPDRYLSHVYGEHEAGGTAWLYLAGIPFHALDFPKLGCLPTPDFTEPIQHAIFKWFLPPLSVYAALGGIWWYMASRRKAEEGASGP
jgi:Fe-S-cluster-containing dehydrogenase component